MSVFVNNKKGVIFKLFFILKVKLRGDGLFLVLIFLFACAGQNYKKLKETVLMFCFFLSHCLVFFFFLLLSFLNIFILKILDFMGKMSPCVIV